MKDYSGFSKDELVAEVKQRGISVDLRGNKEVLISALKMHDVENATPGKAEVAPAAAPKPSGPMARQIPLQPEMPTTATQPTDGVFAKGFKARNNSDGYTYEVVVVKDDSLKPFKARVPKQASGHPGMFWEGSEVEFKETFTKI